MDYNFGNNEASSAGLDKKAVSQLGYDLKLPGMGLSIPAGTPYNANNTPAVVYSQPTNYGVNTGKVLGTNTTSGQNFSSSGLNYTPAGNSLNNNTNNNTAPSNNNSDLISKYKASGWNDINAILADIAAGGGSKFDNQGSIPSFDVNAENQLIDQAYNPQLDALNQNATDLSLSQDSALEQAQKAFNTQQGMAQGQLQTANNQLGEVATKGQSAYESALAQARQVYDQLQRGYQQRFGGASSAGAAATEIGNVERLKQQGQSYKQLQDVNRQVEMGRMDVQKQYDQNILQLEQNKQSAIASVQEDFRTKLAQINASKGMVESAKAQAKLAALQGLRQQVLQVQQQETSFKQQLEMQKQQAAIQLDTYAKQLDMSRGNTTSAANSGINAMGQKITPQATVNQYAASGTAPGYQYTPTGQTTQTGKNWWERLTQ